MLVFGLDPGKSGAIVALGQAGYIAGHCKLSETEADVGMWLRMLVDAHREIAEKHGHDFTPHAFLEQVMAAPRVDKATGTRHQMGASSAFTFGQGYGFLRGLLIALQIPFEEVRPQKWQQAMNCLTKGDKNVSKAKAQQLFPQFKCTHATSDALLIAEYGRRLLAVRNQPNILPEAQAAAHGSATEGSAPQDVVTRCRDEGRESVGSEGNQDRQGSLIHDAA